MTNTPQGISNSKFAKQQLLKTVNNIRSTGAAVDIDLPTIVVAGNQSCGKSSLIEAISGIQLPRAEGTCTKVPTEVRLKQYDGPWECVVKIRREVSEDGEVLDIGVKPEKQFGPVLTDPQNIESTIRRAQLAILNPSVQQQRFVNYDLPEIEEKLPLDSTKQLAFSQNVVVLEVSGPHVVDLTLVDLPGIVQFVSDDQDDNNVELVKDLVRSYIQKDCLILLVITTKDDMENQAARRLAKEADPEGKRTIGVLTKADSIQSPLEAQKWIEILKGNKYPLKHGYYITRLPSADQRAADITFDEARANEEAFFMETPHWSTLPLVLRQRMGIKHVTTSLSNQLTLLIKEKLPKLTDQINRRYNELSAELTELGSEPSDDPASEMLALVSNLKMHVVKNAEGQREYECFVQELKKEYQQFKRDVWGSAPRFVPTTSLPDDPETETEIDCIADLEELAEDSLGSPGSQGRLMDLRDVRHRIKRATTWELPGTIPYPAIEQLIGEILSPWSGMARDLLANIRPIFEEMLEAAVTKTFGKYQHGLLLARIRDIVSTTTNEIFDQLEVKVNMIAAMDRRPFTQNNHYLNDLENKIFARFKASRQAALERDDTAAPTANDREAEFRQALASLTLAGRTFTKDDINMMLKVDGEAELKMMAQVRAYWQVAYKRFIDNIPMVIDSALIHPAANEIDRAIRDDLSITSEAGRNLCRDLLEESPEIAQDRQAIRARRERLNDAKQALRSYGRN